MFKNIKTLCLFFSFFVMIAALMPISALADCSTDVPPTCNYVPAPPQNNKLSVTPAFAGASPSCEQVTNNCSATVMVPTGNQAEWSSFVSSQMANGGCVSLAGCGGGGQCGSDNGKTNLTAPPTNLCANGSLDNSKGGLQGGANGPWSWYCLANGIDSPRCSASEGAAGPCVTPPPNDPGICAGCGPAGTPGGACWNVYNGYACKPTGNGLVCDFFASYCTLAGTETELQINYFPVGDLPPCYAFPGMGK